VHVITRLELGGAQLATLYQVERSAFAAGGRFLLYGPGGMLDGEAQKLNGVTPIAVPALDRPIDPLADGRAVTELLSILRRVRRGCVGQSLMVHTHSSKAGIVGRWAARLAGADRVIHSIHGFGHTLTQRKTAYGLLLGLEQVTSHVTDGFTADSAANIAQGRRQGIIQEIPAEVVRCGIDVQAFAAPQVDPQKTRVQLGVPGGHAVVLAVFCLKAQKDPETFVRVAARVVHQRPQTVFWLAGDGELRPRVERLGAKLGLERALRLLGWRRDVANLMHASDVLLQTSLWEGLPQTYSQAMAARLPIVATRVDGAAEAVADGESGLLCEPGDVDGLARATIALLDDPPGRKRMGECGYQRVQGFSRDTMVGDLDRFYAQVAARPPRRRVRLAAVIAQARALLRGVDSSIGGGGRRQSHARTAATTTAMPHSRAAASTGVTRTDATPTVLPIKPNP
jgi:glycosyltransferase involved in cell wall biosynthesis